MSIATQKANRRQYIRLDSVFPVRMRLVQARDRQPASDWIQGFTNNISKGGICLACNTLAPEAIARIKSGALQCSLEIEIPLGRPAVCALGRVSWFKDATAPGEKYFIGLTYVEINPKDSAAILTHARLRRFFVPLSMLAVGILTVCIIVSGYVALRLSEGNRSLAERLAIVSRDHSAMKQKIEGMGSQSVGLTKRINDLMGELEALDIEKQNNLKQKKALHILNAQISKYAKEKFSLQSRLALLQEKQAQAATEEMRLGIKKIALEKASIEQMYRWLCVHQNPRTGLVMSFEGDPQVEEWAFSYDQALVGQVFLLYHDQIRAKKILDFYATKAQKADQLFVNAYYCREGVPAEAIVHVGPNIWVGMFALQYTARTKDTRYLGLAEGIAQAIMAMQRADPEGGIKGGPSVQWYATEHNLDAYAFFGMLFTLTGQEAYARAQETTLAWLQAHAYDKPEIPIKRGKGDATIATDTYAWSIASLGPEKLQQLQMDPDKIMEFAATHCQVVVDYIRPEGTLLRLKGFDFAAQRNLARGGVISAEWSAQMAISYKIMADYYAKKNNSARWRSYAAKSEELLIMLGSMLISSPSPSGQGSSCLPYASEEVADTGHGWVTPKGKSTGSVAATAYALCAFAGYNPLHLPADAGVSGKP